MNALGTPAPIAATINIGLAESSVLTKKRTIIVVGGSRGIGAAVATHLVSGGDRVLAVSRRPAAAGEWVEADLLEDSGIDAVARALDAEPLDALLYLGGAWEAGAFTERYSFLSSPRCETRNVLGINLIAPILITQALAAALSRAPSPRVVLLGALVEPGHPAREVANTASKAGLRGAAQALANSLRPLGIGVCLLDPENVATAEVEADIAEGRFDPQRPIPLRDLCRTIDYVLSLSRDSVPTRITLAQVHPG